MMLLAIPLLLAACSAEPAGNVADPAPAAPAVPAPAPAPVVGPAPAAAAPAGAAHAATLDAFWARFRTAALAGDAKTLTALSAPVVMQRGTLDDAPVVRLPAAKVPAVVAQLLALPDGADAQGRTLRQLMQAAVRPPREAGGAADSYRFGDLVFARGAKGWRLTELYFEPDAG